MSTPAAQLRSVAGKKPHVGVNRAYGKGRRYYSPTLARWLSRDPIGEEGGWNLFAIVGNRPANVVDIIGLAWDVERRGRPMAKASTECDSVLELAKLIRLDEDEYAKWLTPADGGGLPASAEELVANRAFHIPNRIYILRGYLSSFEHMVCDPYDEYWMNKYEAIAEGHGLEVHRHDDAITDQVLLALKSKWIYALIYLGHGPRWQFTEPSGPTKIDFFSGKLARSTVHHGLASVFNLSCWGRGRDRYSGLVTKYGAYYYHRGKVSCRSAGTNFSIKRGEYKP